MKKPSSSPQNYPSQLQRSPQYPVTAMQHQAQTDLGQQINHIILHSSDGEVMLQQVAQLLGEAFRVDCCLVMAIAENQDATGIGCWRLGDAIAPTLQQIICLENFTAAMGTVANPLVIDDINAVGASWADYWQHLPLSARAILQISTQFQGKSNGLITLLCSQPYHWSESEQEKALAVASSVAIAISQVSQAKLLASLQQQIHASSQYKILLKQLMMASRSSLELNQILQLAIAGTAQTLQVDCGIIITLKYTDPLFKTRSREKIPKAKATVVCEWSSSSAPRVLESPENAKTWLNHSFWLSESLLCQLAFTKANPVVIANQNDLLAIDLATDKAPLFDLAKLGGLVIFALESQGTVLGFLVLQHSSDRHWEPQELALVELVSAQLSTVIIQNQTLRQVQSLVEERTIQLQRSLEVQGKLYEKTRQQIDQLRQLNQLKDEFLSNISDRLRHPLTNMNLAIRMLRQAELPPERQGKYLDILEQQCTQEINLINDLLTLQQLESHQVPLNLETIDLKPKILSLTESFEQAWADKGLTITVDLPLTSLNLQTDFSSLERILQELLSNAGKYSNPDTNVILRATHQLNQFNQIVLTLTNLGRGISPEETAYIFDKFRRGQDVTEQAIKGTGLGLALVKCLVQQLNGTIDVSSIAVADASAYETCFTLTLPQFFAPH